MRQQQSSGSALASAALGIGAVVCAFTWLPLAIICGALAIVLAVLARGEIRRGAGRIGGERMATAGLVLGIVALALVTIICVLLISFMSRNFP